jgi:hypothetical protein
MAATDEDSEWLPPRLSVYSSHVALLSASSMPSAFSLRYLMHVYLRLHIRDAPSLSES